MRTIVVANSKGGCGKTTIATNIAGYFAQQRQNVALADFDPQGSALAWLAARAPERPAIHGLAAWRDPLWLPRDTDVVVMDVAAGVGDRRLNALIRRAQTVIVPVLPSPFDMRVAGDFIRHVTGHEKVAYGQAKIALVANRVRDNTRSADLLAEFLAEQRLPLIASLRDSQNYVHAAERGLGVFELASSGTDTELEQWQPIIKWLKSKHSQLVVR